MRQRLIITITDFRGSRHYSFNQIVRKVALAFGVAALVAVVGGTAAIVWLNEQVGDLEAKRDQALTEYARLMTINGSLQDTVDAQSTRLDTFTNRLQQVESLIGLRADDDVKLHQRLNTATHTALLKTTLLRNVPNGSPVEYRGVTSSYGWRASPEDGEREFHPGVDLRAAKGTPVRAPADGVVEYAGYHKKSGYGNLLIISHNYGFRTFYGHLDRFAVASGDFVRKGEVVAYTGNTGRSNGPHLHYEIWQIQRRLNPLPFVKWSLKNYDSIFDKEAHVKWDSLVEGVQQRLSMQEQRLSLLGPSLSATSN